MGRYDLRHLRVHDVASLLTRHKWQVHFPTPPWLEVMKDTPPAQALVRLPAVQHREPVRSRRVKKASRMFQPQTIRYEEDDLRHTFFKDHPWELARPRILVEEHGNDHKNYDWSKPLNRPDGRPLNGESVVQRQLWLLKDNQESIAKANVENQRRRKAAGPDETPDLVPVAQVMTTAKAYDVARREFYEQRHYDEMERIVQLEEARSTGAYFGLSTNDVSMHLENQQFDNWRKWAHKTLAEQQSAKAAAGVRAGGGRPSTEEDPLAETLENVVDDIGSLSAEEAEREDGRR